MTSAMIAASRNNQFFIAMTYFLTVG